MSLDDESLLECLAEEFTERLRAGENPTIATYAKRHPALYDDISEMLRSIQLMEQLSRCESDSRAQANARNTPTPSLKELGDFDIVREIGRGGMGVVYEATDRTLQRRVALKVLHESALATRKHVERFQRESRLAAQLHHTNIVSVFGVGEEDRKHFYAMQYVEGVSVQDILDGLRQLASADGASETGPRRASAGLKVAAALQAGHFENQAFADASPITVTDDSDMTGNLDPADAVSQLSNSRPPHRPQLGDTLRRPYWRSVARLGSQVADALHYAHSNGILHRDIKPANLLFDQHGTAWVADFGLAKLSETDDLTQTGDVVGTLKYMAPEQLAGRADSRTDIYALGMTLYELMTLHPVCDGETYKELFAQKQAPVHAAPRKLNSRIPPDLETIVQKALAWEPDQRYRSARELSEDLRRFLDDEPIRARRTTVAEKAWRWCRRNRALAALGAMAACLFAALPIILGSAYVRESRQNQRMEKTVNVVLDGFDELFGAYLEDDVATAAALTDASADAQLAPAMLTKDTARVLEKMLVVYDRLAEQNASSTSLSLAVESAKARRRVGDLYQRLGQFSEARQAYQDAASRYGELSRQDAKHWIDIARIHHAIGQIYEQQQDFALSNTEYERAIESLKRAPDSNEAQFVLAWTHYLLGKQPIIEGRTPRERPRGYRQPFDNWGRRPGLARSSGPPATEPNDRSPLPKDEKHAHLETTIQIVRSLRASDTTHAGYRFLLALCLREKERAGLSSDAADENSVELLNGLAKQFPAASRYRYELCETYRSFDRDTPNVGQEERLVRLHRAKELGEQLVKEQRDAAPFRIILAHTYAHLGTAYGEMGDIKQAEDFTRLSIVTHKSITLDFPGLASLSDRLLTNDQLRLGVWLLRLHRYEELIELIEPLGERLFAQIDGEPERNGDLATTPEARLRECAHLLLPAYESLDDDVGYLVAVGWLGMTGDPHAGNAGFPPNFRRAMPPPTIGPVELALSYDTNKDGRITRDEVPSRMASEWFYRADTNGNGDVDPSELESLLLP